MWFGTSVTRGRWRSSRSIVRTSTGEFSALLASLLARVKTDGRMESAQMYCPNNLMDHPLVSPVNQGSLGGLCPLYIVSSLSSAYLSRPKRSLCRSSSSQAAGSDELLRDEITYIAHKAANPSAYPPSSHILETYPTQRAHLEAEYPATLVQFQLFEGGCHVATTLSVASIAKYVSVLLSSRPLQMSGD